jgi:hypothetical protein
MRRVLVRLVTALGLAVPVALGAPASPASAAPTDIVAVIVDGVGNGHGRGMSQWGAYGWAVDQGWNWVQILDHYYGGTSNGTVNSAQTRIKVRLLGLDNLNTVGLVSHGPGVSWGGHTRASMYAVETSPGTFDVYGTGSIACPSAASLTVPSGNPVIGFKSADSGAVRQIQTFLKAFHDGAIVIDGDFGNQTDAILRSWQIAQALPNDGSWGTEDAARANAQISASAGSVSWSKLGSASGTLRFSTNTDESGSAPTAVLGVCSAAGGVTHYRGAIEVSSQSDGNRVVNDVATENYLRGVVPKEISASWTQAGGGRGAEAVRAQAVAARSYGLQQSRYSYASTCDSQSCQVYGGAATRPVATGTATLVEDFRTDQAIAATAGIVRFRNGSIVSTEFSASNGPRTAGGAFPPVDDAPGDGTSSNPNHRWTRILDADALAAQYGLGTLTGATMVEAQSTVNQQFDGIWFNDVVLTGTAGTRRIPAWDFRGSNGLPSPGFTVRVVTRDSLGTNAALIGDSVGESAKDEFTTLTDGTFASLRIDTLVSRFITKTPPSPSGVQVAAGLPTNLDLAVVELGYNPSTNMAADIDAMMTTLNQRGTKQVIWVNMADVRGTYAAANAALQEARGRWPNLAIADWNAASAAAGAERARWISSDGVHLTTTGQAQFALWLRQVLVSAVDTRLAPPKRIEIQVTGRSVTGPDGKVTTIPDGVSAASFNVTAVTPAGSGFVTVWPCSVPRPLASNLNYTLGSIDANGVIAPVDSSGKACLYSHVATDIVVDIAGWFGPGSTGGSGFQSITPRRLVDSRDGTGVPVGRIRPEAPIQIQVVGAAAQTITGSPTTVPANAVAAAINVTSVSSVGPGYITVWPCGVERPVVSTLNFSAGAIRANGAIAALGSGGTLCLYSHAPTDVVVDIVGWFTAGASPASSAFVSPIPARWVDTREGLGAPSGAVSPAQPIEIPVAGRQMNVGGQLLTIPADVEAVSLNVVSVDAPGPGFVTVWPCGAARPTTSNLNYPGRNIVANNVIATVGVGGSVCLYVHSATHVVVDVTGWFNRGDAYSAAVPDRAVDTRYAIGPGPV